MSDPIIRVENLSKKYIIDHQKSERNDTLRDAITSGAKYFGQRLLGKSEKPSFDSSHEEFWALKDVSFEIKQGDRVGIIGRNGAGKSTLLKILSRITEPTAGKVSIKGRVASLLEVGTGFHPELTGRENIFLNGAILGMSKEEIKRKFDEIVAFAEIEKFLDTPVKRYSSGMYVRLAFAVAAHLEPEILIVDEVLAVGDVAFQKKCLGKMEAVGGEGRTIIFVSHSVQSVRRLCTRAIYLEKGVNKPVRSVEEAIDLYSIQSFISEYDVDLDAISRQGSFGEKARLLRAKIASEKSLRYEEPLELIVTIQCFDEISDLAIGVGFDSLDGYRLMTLDSDQEQMPLQLPVGVHEISLYLPRNPLSPGIYSIGASILTGVQTLDFTPNAITWEVNTSTHDRISDRGNGGCRLPVKTHVIQTLSKLV